MEIGFAKVKKVSNKELDYTLYIVIADCSEPMLLTSVVQEMSVVKWKMKKRRR